MRQRSLPGLCAAALASALALAACGGSSAPTAQARVPSTTIAPADPYAVPAHITTAYVQRVLDALEGINASATAEIVRTRTMDPAAASFLRAEFSEQEFRQQTDSWLNQISQGLPNYQTHPGPIRDLIDHVISASPGCIFVAANRDFSAVAIKPPAPHTSYIQLVPVSPSGDPSHLNPTGWVVNLAGFNSQGQVPANPCVAS